MASRTRLIDFRLSDGPQALGLCQNDLPSICRIVNQAQERLIYCKESGDEGWYGGWAEMVFNVDPANPYITCNRGIARLESIDVCTRPIPVNNSFYEYLRFGNGRLPKSSTWRRAISLTQAVQRNNAVTFLDLTNTPQKIRIYPTSVDDVGKRVFVSGPDANGNTIYTTDNNVRVAGEFITIASPFATSVNEFTNPLSGMQKDVTAGQVQIFQVDQTSGDEVQIGSMEPSETNASYRRYYIDQLPCSCCPTSTDTTTVQVTALAKLDLIPATCDTDFLLIQSVEALIAECQSLRFSRMDDPMAMQRSAERHLAAVRLLIGQSTHFEGKNQPATNFAPFGTAHLSRVNIGMT